MYDINSTFQNGRCHFSDKGVVIGAKLTGYVNITSGDLNQLREAIALKGPISVGIDAAHLSLSFYAHGVYYEPKCGKLILHFCTTIGESLVS